MTFRCFFAVRKHSRIRKELKNHAPDAGLLNLLDDRMWPRAAGRSIHSENQPITKLYQNLLKSLKSFL